MPKNVTRKISIKEVKDFENDLIAKNISMKRILFFSSISDFHFEISLKNNSRCKFSFKTIWEYLKSREIVNPAPMMMMNPKILIHIPESARLLTRNCTERGTINVVMPYNTEYKMYFFGILSSLIVET